MRGIIKDSFKLYGRIIIVGLLCFFVVISIFTLATSAWAESVGYTAYGAKEGDEETTVLYTHYLTDGEDTKMAEYEEQGYAVQKMEIKELSRGKNTASSLIAQFFALGILASFVYPTMWDKGNKALNLVRIGRQNEDKLYGLKVGAFAMLPPVIMFLCLIFMSDTKAILYYFVNVAFFPVIKLILEGKSGNAAAVLSGDLNALQLIGIFATVFVTPLVAHLGYTLGYKDIAVAEKLIYKKASKRR